MSSEPEPVYLQDLIDKLHEERGEGLIGYLQARITVNNRELAALREENERVNERFPCGHRKLDWDDSYGGCVACSAIAAMQSEDTKDARIARLEAALRVVDGHGCCGMLAEIARKALDEKEG